MRLIMFSEGSGERLAAVTDEGRIYALEQPDFMTLVHEARADGGGVLDFVTRLIASRAPLGKALEELRLGLPIRAQEVWAAGVTYERSRQARNYEVARESASAEPVSAQSAPAGPTAAEPPAAATFYDKVYEADRPELFLKSGPLRTVGPGEELCLRSDSGWQVPEPELGLVLDREGRIVGYTIGNDMSSRDIEGENPLYLPQAKIWRRSCAIGPAIRLAEAVDDPYDLNIACAIYRNGAAVAEGAVSTRQLKRRLEELVDYLIRDNDIYDGTVLLTGTGVVPPDDFTLQSGDRVDITISGIGTLSNPIR